MLRRRSWLWIVLYAIVGGGLTCGPKPPKGPELPVEWLKNKELEGVVWDGEEGVAGIEVRIVQGGQTLDRIQTTRRGNFRFDRIPKGEFGLKIVETKEWEGAQEVVSEEAFRYTDRYQTKIKVSPRKTRLVGHVFWMRNKAQEPAVGVDVQATPDPKGELIGRTGQTGRYEIVLGDEFMKEYVLFVVVGDSVAASTNTKVQDIQKLEDNPVTEIVITDQELVEDLEGYIASKAHRMAPGKAARGD